MSLAEIKEKAAALTLEEQQELRAYLAARHAQQDPEFMELLERKIEDRNPANWVRLEDAAKRLAE